MLNKVIPITTGEVSARLWRLKKIWGIASNPANIPHRNKAMPMMLAQFSEALTILLYSRECMNELSA